jgi:choline dehydrogenase-like flavoprotein
LPSTEHTACGRASYITGYPRAVRSADKKFEKEVGEGGSRSTVDKSDEALGAYVRATVTTQFHPCITVRMGPADDAMAVVDAGCRIRGLDNLRVVDASIMPNIPRANINLTSIMIGERVADWMRGE